MVTLDEKTVGLWYLAITETQDWMGSIRELIPDEKYELVHRFRYYVDDKVFESNDTKNWYRGEITGTRHYVVSSFRQVVAGLRARAIGPLYEYMNNGDYRELMKRLQDAPFMYMRTETIKKEAS